MVFKAQTPVKIFIFFVTFLCYFLKLKHKVKNWSKMRWFLLIKLKNCKFRDGFVDWRTLGVISHFLPVTYPNFPFISYALIPSLAGALPSLSVISICVLLTLIIFTSFYPSFFIKNITKDVCGFHLVLGVKKHPLSLDDLSLKEGFPYTPPNEDKPFYYLIEMRG